MTREGQKRFCDACKKHVHDLSALRPAEAKALLRADEAAELCVRYLYDEQGNVLFRPSEDLVPPRALTRMRRFVTAAGVLAVPLSLNACMGARVMDPPTPTPAASASAPIPVVEAPDASAVVPTSDATDASAAIPIVTDRPIPPKWK